MSQNPINFEGLLWGGAPPWETVYFHIFSGPSAPVRQQPGTFVGGRLVVLLPPRFGGVLYAFP